MKERKELSVVGRRRLLGASSSSKTELSLRALSLAFQFVHSFTLAAHLDEVLSCIGKEESIERLPRADDAAAAGAAATHLADDAVTDTAARGISDAAFPPRRHVFIMARSSSDVIVFRSLQGVCGKEKER